MKIGMVLYLAMPTVYCLAQLSKVVLTSGVTEGICSVFFVSVLSMGSLWLQKTLRDSDLGRRHMMAQPCNHMIVLK